MPGLARKSRDNTGHVGGALRHLLQEHQKIVADLETLRQALSGDIVTIGTSLSRGSTDTNLANTAFTFTIGGVPVTKAAVAAGTALGALGTIPQDKWGIIAVDVIAAGTVSYVSGAANYTTGYATEALAILALPARITGKARVGYITIQTKTGATFVAGTDALAGGATGNPANTTNYYPTAGAMAATGLATNGIIIPTVLAIGSTDTRVSTTAFTYNIAGIPLAKAAVAAGTAFGALGTVPIGKWALIAIDIDSAGTITYVSAAHNYDFGYGTEAQAIQDNPAATAGKCRVGYVTILTHAGTTFVVGTDSPAGGATGNVATTTNYYPAAGVTLGSGMTAAVLADESGVVFVE